MMSGFPVTVAIPVQWGDMDALGHVNNTRYLAWFESARIALFQRVGVATTGAADGIGPILATTTCDFVLPVVWPATMAVGTRVAKVGETSIALDYEIRDAAVPERLHARGSSVVVMFDYRTQRKVRVPEDIRAAIEGLAS